MSSSEEDNHIQPQPIIPQPQQPVIQQPPQPVIQQPQQLPVLYINHPYNLSSSESEDEDQLAGPNSSDSETEYWIHHPPDPYPRGDRRAPSRLFFIHCNCNCLRIQRAACQCRPHNINTTCRCVPEDPRQ
jgi:hypothetical protein